MPSKTPAAAKPSSDLDSASAAARDVSQEQLGSEKNPATPQPKMPHERDEGTGRHSTANEQTAGNADIMRQAHDDIESGKQDTDRGPVADKTYHELRKKK